MLDRLPYAAFERDALIRTAEVALGVSTKSHLFMWMQLHLHRFVPHEMALCHHPSSGCHRHTHLFHTVAMSHSLESDLTTGDGQPLHPLRQHWISAERQPSFIELSDLQAQSRQPVWTRLREAGIQRLLVHGVDPTAGLRSESLFAFGSSAQPEATRDQATMAGLALWMPYLHACTARALTSSHKPTARGLGHLEAAPAPSALTQRELQILQAVRHARRTDEIAEQFGISPLTVKNHVRKIMSKLGARSRVHAVAEALSRQIIS